jgi:hypothetical protein
MNKKFFKRLTVVLIVCLAFIGEGCKKYLDQQPITAVGPDVVFNSVENARSALIGAYAQLTGDLAYGLRVSLYFPTGTDEMQGPTGAADGSRRDFPLYATTPTNNNMFQPYTQLFKGIQYANLCIANIPEMDLYNNGSEQQKKQLQRMYGEALTLRAQFYSEAIRNWGDLPAHFEPAEVLALKDPFPPRVDKDGLLEHLLDDLKNAEELVPWKNEITSIGDAADERITKGTVKALRARIALARGGYSLRQDGTIKRGSNYQTYYQIAKDETNSIISSGQHNLNPSYKDLWKGQVGSRAVVDPHGELMFQATGIGRTSAADTKMGYYNGPTVVDLATQTGSTGNSGVLVLPTYFYLFDSTDTRRDVTCAAYSDTLASDGVTFYKRGVPITGIFDGKYRRSWINPPLPRGTYLNNYSTTKWQIIRYSDVLLMFAEAENELNGPTTAAFNAINMVRRRGFGKPINAADPSVDLAGLSKDDFFKALVRERSLELGGEGVRKFDLIRWNLLATAISETKANLTKMGARTAITAPSYMAPPPSYTLNAATLADTLYYRGRTSSDDLNIGGLVVNSLYKKTTPPAPAGVVKMAWVTNAISVGTGTAVTLNHYANNFVTLKSELLPIPQDAITAYGSFANKMPQNPNY